jgi:hypothetical protein
LVLTEVYLFYRFGAGADGAETEVEGVCRGRVLLGCPRGRFPEPEDVAIRTLATKAYSADFENRRAGLGLASWGAEAFMVLWSVRGGEGEKMV